MHLCHALASVHRDVNEPDLFCWPATNTASYSAKSIYDYLCSGLQKSPTAACTWRSRATLKCKLFIWLALQYRLWTSDSRARHGLQDQPSPCFTCLQAEDNVDHILAKCTFAQEVWHRVFNLLGLNVVGTTQNDTFSDWWMRERKKFRGADRRGFDTLVTAVAWILWKQRNARVFSRHDQQKPALLIPNLVIDEITTCHTAGLGVGRLQHFVRS